MTGADKKVNAFLRDTGILVRARIQTVFYSLKKDFTNLIYVHQEVNIGVPFHVKRVVKDQNHGSSLSVDQSEHNGYVIEQGHYYEVMFGTDGELLPLHGLSLHYGDLA